MANELVVSAITHKDSDHPLFRLLLPILDKKYNDSRTTAQSLSNHFRYKESSSRSLEELQNSARQDIIETIQKERKRYENPRIMILVEANLARNGDNKLTFEKDFFNAFEGMGVTFLLFHHSKMPEVEWPPHVAMQINPDKPTEYRWDISKVESRLIDVAREPSASKVNLTVDVGGSTGKAIANPLGGGGGGGLNALGGGRGPGHEGIGGGGKVEAPEGAPHATEGELAARRAEEARRLQEETLREQAAETLRRKDMI